MNIYFRNLDYDIDREETFAVCDILHIGKRKGNIIVTGTADGETKSFCLKITSSNKPGRGWKSPSKANELEKDIACHLLSEAEEMGW